MKRAILLLSLLSFNASADQLFVGYGGDNKAKVFNLGVREEFFSDGYIQAKAGYFGDLFASFGGGIILDFKPFEARAGLGLAFTSGSPTAGLNGEVYLGLRDRRGNGIGVQYENIGKHDFISIQASTEF